MPGQVTRRGFLGWLRTAAAVPTAASAPPANAWIILERHWEHNDEVSYPDGEFPLGHVFYDEAQAEAECQRLCQQFYARSTPEDFEVDLQEYVDVHPDSDESGVTWDELVAAGLPRPYTVQLLTAVRETPS